MNKSDSMYGNYSFREQRLWDAVFGAAFVNEFNRHKSAMADKGGIMTFNKALRSGLIETAEVLADAALEEWRQWKNNEGRTEP